MASLPPVDALRPIPPAPLAPRPPSAYSARSEGAEGAPPIGRAGGLLSQTGGNFPLLTPFSASYIPLYDFVPLENRRDMYEASPSGYENPIGFQPFKSPENCCFSGFLLTSFNTICAPSICAPDCCRYVGGAYGVPSRFFLCRGDAAPLPSVSRRFAVGVVDYAISNRN